MRNLSTLALGLIGAASLAAASDVAELKKDTFEPFIKEHDLVLAEFFAPWCGHCKALAPEYEEAATALKEKNIALAKIDCTEEADLCQSFGVEGYPTLKVFRGMGSISPYAGQRKAPAIISYMTKQAMPAVSILDKDTIEDFKTADKVVVIAFFDANDQGSNQTFTAVGDQGRDSFLFGATSDPALAKAEGVTQPGIALYKQFDEGKNILQESFTQDAIKEFVKTASVPLIGEVGPETYAGYMSAGLPLAYIFAETPEERQELSEALKPVAEKYKGKVNFATIDAKAFGQHGGNLNLEVGKWPAFAIQETVKNQKFPYSQSQKINEKNIGKFVEDFVSGKVEPSIKSEPVPEKQDGPVTVVVAKNYQEIVMDDDKDVLIEYYAPWCGHCKSLAPKYEELGTLYSSIPKVVIAKVDATANDVPEEIQGFPTIKLFPAGRKSSPVDYSGARTVDDLAKFIEENGTHKAAMPKGGAGGSAGGSSEQMVMDVDDDTTMAHQAPAATKAAGEAAEGVKESVVSGAESVKASATSVAKEGVKESVKSVASEAAQAVKTAMMDTDSEAAEEHDEL